MKPTMTKAGQAAALLATMALAGCLDTSGSRDAPVAPATSSGAAATSERSYPGLFAEYQGKFHPNHEDLGGRSNAELAALLPVSADFPDPGPTRGPDAASEDGSGLGLHGQTEGETRPPECLNTPFGKSYSRTDDGSDWNLYYAASTVHNPVSTEAGEEASVVVTVNRERVGADVFALTADWIKNCGQYDRAFPTFAAPSLRNRHVVDTFGPGARVDGVQTYVYTSTSTDLDDSSASKQSMGPQVQNKRAVLARVRGVVFEVQAHGRVDPAVLDQLMATTIVGAEHAPPPAGENRDRLAGLPHCDTLAPPPANAKPDAGLDCTVSTNDGSGTLFEVLGTPARTIRVFNGDGALTQTIRIPESAVGQRLPFVDDVDQDKREELLVVTASGGEGETLDIWRAPQNTNRFEMTGTVFGFPRFWSTPDRFAGIQSHRGADAGTVTLFRFVDNRLVPLALLDTERREGNGPIDPKWKLNSNVLCAMNTSDDPPGAFAARNDALRAAGLDPGTAEEHLCMQPWVRGLYRQR